MLQVVAKVLGADADQSAGEDFLPVAPPGVVVQLACASIQERDAGAVGDCRGHRLAAAPLVGGDVEQALGHRLSLPRGIRLPALGWPRPGPGAGRLPRLGWPSGPAPDQPPAAPALASMGQSAGIGISGRLGDGSTVLVTRGADCGCPGGN